MKPTPHNLLLRPPLLPTHIDHVASKRVPLTPRPTLSSHQDPEGCAGGAAGRSPGETWVLCASPAEAGVCGQPQPRGVETTPTPAFSPPEGNHGKTIKD